jgi:hypothetical protein
LDLSVPENKMMLAFYLAVPEVENARRSLNIKQDKGLPPAPLGKNYARPVQKKAATIIRLAISHGLSEFNEIILIKYDSRHVKRQKSLFSKPCKMA